MHVFLFFMIFSFSYHPHTFDPACTFVHKTILLVDKPSLRRALLHKMSNNVEKHVLRQQFVHGTSNSVDKPFYEPDPGAIQDGD